MLGAGIAGVAGGIFAVESGPASRPTATTDNAGHFVFSDLDAGNYIVQAAADGYARQQAGPSPAGQTGMTTAVAVSAGQTASGVVLHLTPAGNVSGRVTGGNGEPIVGLDVSVLRVNYSAGGRRNVSQAGTAQTNDKGEYRLFWIAPGKYYLAVSVSNRPLPGVAMIPGGGKKYPQTFYPGVTDFAAAAEIDVPGGGELSGMDFRLQDQPSFKVRGRVVDSSTGQAPRSASISITPSEQIGGGMTSSSSPYNPSTGTFELRDVIAGSYWVRAQLPVSFPTGGPPPRPPMAIAAVEVRSSDVDNVVLTVLPPASIAGRIRVDARTPPPLDRVRVTLQPSGSGLVFGIPQPATVNADGTFVLDGVSPGEYQVNVAGLGPSPANLSAGATAFYVREARYGAVDVLSEPLSIFGPATGDLQIVVAADSGQVSGTVTDSRQPAAPTLAVLVPDLRNRRDLYKTAGVSNGAFTFKNVEPGSYRIFAVDQSLMQSLYDPAVLQKLEPAGKAVTVSASQTASVALQVISSY